MKIQIVKKADKTTRNAECPWVVEGLPEPKK
jgi:hypothetical protein